MDVSFSIHFCHSVAPSVPVCELNGRTYVGNDVTLTCHSSQGVPMPIYSWTQDTNTAPLPPNSFIAGMYNNSHRFFFKPALIVRD